MEDAGDTLHGQRNALDSGWIWDVGADYANSANQPVRWLAEGRDSAATIDADNGGFGKNDGDNEDHRGLRLRRRSRPAGNPRRSHP